MSGSAPIPGLDLATSSSAASDAMAQGSDQVTDLLSDLNASQASGAVQTDSGNVNVATGKRNDGFFEDNAAAARRNKTATATTATATGSAMKTVMWIGGAVVVGYFGWLAYKRWRG